MLPSGLEVCIQAVWSYTSRSLEVIHPDFWRLRIQTSGGYISRSLEITLPDLLGITRPSCWGQMQGGSRERRRINEVGEASGGQASTDRGEGNEGQGKQAACFLPRFPKQCKKAGGLKTDIGRQHDSNLHPCPHARPLAHCLQPPDAGRLLRFLPPSPLLFPGFSLFFTKIRAIRHPNAV
jgi:hypothetical protein